jgi:hypothetical protein
MPQSEQINFRASPEFIESLLGAAVKIGSNMSEFIREAVIARVDSEPVWVPPFDPNSTLLLAAVGDLGAQRAMAAKAYDDFLRAVDNEDDDIAAIALTECTTFARMAALQGTTRDCEILVFALGKFGQWQNNRGRTDIGHRLDAAGLIVADDLADNGHEAMAEMVANAGLLSAETLEEAKRQREAGQ